MLPVPEKKEFPYFFNITSTGKKLISKNHLAPAPPSFLLRFRLKINKNQGMILGKFQWFKTWNVVQMIQVFKGRASLESDGVKNSDFKFFYISNHLGPDFSWFLCQQKFHCPWFWSRDKQIFVVDKKLKVKSNQTNAKSLNVGSSLWLTCHFWAHFVSDIKNSIWVGIKKI